jgi:hypothetical protein
MHSSSDAPRVVLHADVPFPLFLFLGQTGGVSYLLVSPPLDLFGVFFGRLISLKCHEDLSVVLRVRL